MFTKFITFSLIGGTSIGGVGLIIYKIKKETNSITSDEASLPDLPVSSFAVTTPTPKDITNNSVNVVSVDQKETIVETSVSTDINTESIVDLSSLESLTPTESLDVTPPKLTTADTISTTANQIKQKSTELQQKQEESAKSASKNLPEEKSSETALTQTITSDTTPAQTAESSTSPVI